MTNRDKFLALLDQGDVTQTAAAKLIADQTMRPCSLRTVQAWLADPEKTSARTCPDWAILALETKLRVLRKIV